MTAIRFENIEKRFGEAAIIADLNLTIEDGEFFTFVGPSGCGKSTLLHLIAGIEEPTRGTLFFDAEPVNGLAPRDRDVAMVFQSYALYPHLTVARNLAFPLSVRKLPKREIDEQVSNIADVLGLTELLARKPKALSGGQRQRVALGRALVRRPRAFLMDEPLSNLDARLRLEMREELKRLHSLFPATTVYVTHDQEEALALSDRVAVLDRGRIQQCDSPQAIYDRPANLFVAEFIGSPPINVLEGEQLRALVGSRLDKFAERGLRVGIRPADVTVSRAPGETALEARISVVEPTGNDTWIIGEWQGLRIRGRLGSGESASAGDIAHFHLDLNRAHVFAESGERLGSM